MHDTRTCLHVKFCYTIIVLVVSMLHQSVLAQLNRMTCSSGAITSCMHDDTAPVVIGKSLHYTVHMQ